MKSKLNELFQIIKMSKEKILIHCAAGIHRTGCVAYCICRISGLDKQQSMERIEIMRKVTYEQVG